MIPPSPALLTLEERQAVEQVRPGCYRHYRGGLYVVLGIARNDDTKELSVVYRSRQSYDDGLLRVRPVAEWLGLVDNPDGGRPPIARFVRVDMMAMPQ